jgi:dTDP-4-amino-4,6-dideoxygalactose transaminase
MGWKVPLFDADFGDDEVEAVASVLRSGWLTMGEVVRDFETKFASMLKVKHAIAVSSGTAALHLANKALGLGPGDDVICPSLTFVASANAISYVGANPVFADITSLDEWNISVDTVEAVRTSSTKAICVVHYAGYPCHMDAICEYARQKGFYVIEDCAHAPGVFYKGKALGVWGNIGCFSFFSNKNMSTGEGGMVTTDDDEIAENIRLLRSHGMTTLTLDRYKGHAHSYDVVDMGYNYRPTEITGALGLVQLAKLRRKNEKRRNLVHHCRKLLATETPEIQVPFSTFLLDQAGAHILPVLLPEAISRAKVMDYMQKHGVQTSIHYKPIHTLSAYTSEKYQVLLPITEKIGGHTITLPLFPKMNKSDLEYVVSTLSSALNR